MRTYQLRTAKLLEQRFRRKPPLGEDAIAHAISLVDDNQHGETLLWCALARAEGDVALFAHSIGMVRGPRAALSNVIRAIGRSVEFATTWQVAAAAFTRCSARAVAAAVST